MNYRGKVAICSIIAEPDTYATYLLRCINRAGITPITYRGDHKTCIAKQYNRFLDQTKERYVMLAHPDFVFSQDMLPQIEKCPGVMGAVGVRPIDNGRSREYVWAKYVKEPTVVGSFDGMCIIVDKEHGIRFDDKTFTGLHCYNEDYCYQAQAKGIKCYIMPCTLVGHGTSWAKRDPERIKFWKTQFYAEKAKLKAKWPQFQVVTT